MSKTVNQIASLSNTKQSQGQGIPSTVSASKADADNLQRLLKDEKPKSPAYRGLTDTEDMPEIMPDTKDVIKGEVVEFEYIRVIEDHDAI